MATAGPIKAEEMVVGTTPVVAEDVAPSPATAEADLTLAVDDETTLAITSDCLVVTNRTQATQSIPLYNVLWSELSDEDTAIKISFADQAKPTKPKVATLTFPLLRVESQPTASAATFTSTLLARAYGPAKPARRAKVLVNPYAGPGAADKLWDQQARPIFEAARMTLDVERTTHSGQAVDIAADLDIDAYDIIVACSGDGLPHEIFNGLGRRPDARRALSKIAVAHVPCGSGNAMSCNLYGTHRAGLAALAIVKGVPTPMDLVSITQGDKRYLSFLSQSLGIVAESDLATEHLRWMGETRFTWGFLVRIFKRTVYPCDLAVKVEIENKDGVKEHYRRVRSYHSLNTLANGDESGTSGKGSTPVLEEEVGSGSSSAVTGRGGEEGLPALKYGTVNDELPEGWELVSYNKMGNFYCGNMAYMAPDANFFSAACANDGLADLVCINGDISVPASLSLLLSVENGKFFDNPLVSYRKISAYRIIPRQKEGYISIDGERVPFSPFQAEVHRGLGTVISKTGAFEAPGPRDWDRVSMADRLIA